MSFKILTLNNISVRGLERLPRDRYEVASEIGHPDAVLVRSADMHEMEMPASVKAVARAGAGTNNIPVAKLSQARHPGVQRARRQRERGQGAGDRRHVPRRAQHLPGVGVRARSAGRRRRSSTRRSRRARRNSSATSCPGRTLGVVGLGAIGVEVANAAHLLGMRVLGFDPQITVQRAWQLSSGVEQALSLDDLFARCDMVTVHVPLLDATRGLVNAARLRLHAQRAAWC